MAVVFDPKQLLKRFDNRWDEFSDTVEVLMTDGRDLMREIRKAAARGDAPTIGHAANTIKGMISDCGSPAVYASALEVETMARQGDLAAAAKAVHTLDAQFDEMIGGLAAFRGPRS